MALQSFGPCIWAKCTFCGSKHRGPLNKKAASGEYYFVSLQRNGRGDGWVLCGACENKNVDRLQSKEFGCLLCSKHPSHHFTDKRFWVYDILKEQPGCKMLSLFCSSECKIEYYKLLKMFGTPRLCHSCQAIKPVKKCAGCGLVYYCSAECQMQHWKKIHAKECLR